MQRHTGKRAVRKDVLSGVDIQSYSSCYSRMLGVIRKDCQRYILYGTNLQGTCREEQ